MKVIDAQIHIWSKTITPPSGLHRKVSHFTAEEALAEMDEAGWLKYTADLHTRPIMPDFAVRAMHEDDRRALYRFIRSLGNGSVPPEALIDPYAGCPIVSVPG